MKKFFFYLLASLVLSLNVVPSLASFIKTEEARKTEVVPKPETSVTSLPIEQILSLTPDSYEQLTGKKMSFKDRLGLKLVQKSIKKELKKNGSVDLNEYFQEGMPSFNIGGFLLGLLLGLIGVALAHIFSNNKSFRRSSWYGLGVWLIILIIAALV